MKLENSLLLGAVKEPKPGHMKVEFQCSRIAPTMDDIFEAIADKRIMASDTVQSLFNSVITKGFEQHVEQFNFGKLDVSAVREATREAHDFIKHGHYTLPFKICLYRVTVDYQDGLEPSGIALLVVDGEGSSSKFPGSATLAFTMSQHADKRMIAMHSINMMNTKDIPGEGVAVEVQIPKGEWKYWTDTIAGTIDKQPMQPQDLADGSQLAMGLTMIINTKGVRKERSAPPEKPNKARVKAGKPLLPWVTRVYTDVYNKAIEPGTGTHASPRPHRRRAHIRTYPATQYREAYSIPIAAMLVNWDGQPLAERNEYEVHRG
jgi:hypothetical protein